MASRGGTHDWPINAYELRRFYFLTERDVQETKMLLAELA